MAATTITRTSFTDSTSPSTGDIWNAALIGTSIYDKVDALLTGSTLRQERSSSGQVSFTVASASNTSGSDAILQSLVAGTSGGDAQLVLVITSGSTWSIGVDNSDSDFLKITNSATTGANTFVFDTAGKFYLGDTLNGSMTIGVTLNQGASDDEIFALKSSDVAHGITTVTETDTYGSLLKGTATQGGLLIRGLSSGAQAGLELQGMQTTADTSKATGSQAALRLDAYLKSGTTTTTVGANGNLMVITDNGSTRFIFDAEGDSHEDGTGWTAYDEYDDVALITSVEGALSRDPLREQFRSWMTYNHEALEKARLVTFGETGRAFVNRSRLQMALCGAIRQLAAKVRALEAA